MSSFYEELGVPVRSVNWVRVHAGLSREGRDRVWATMGQQAEGFFVLDINPENGECRQVLCDNSGSNYPTATFCARSGILYVGAAHTGRLYAYDGESLSDLGEISPEKAIFPCRIDEDSDGKIWIGSYGGADLTRFCPESGTFERFGKMDDIDMYCYPMADYETGLVACLIKVTQQHVVLFDPNTGNKSSIGPALTKEEGAVDLIRGKGGRLFITTDGGNYVIEGREAKPYQEEILQDVPALSTRETFSFADADTFLYRQLAASDPAKGERTVEVAYDAAGSKIFMLHEGPDKRVYGSSILPLHFFAHSPATGETTDYGKASESGGEAYSMANLGEKIYISSYPAARISVYTPGQDYLYGESVGANPQELGRIDSVSYRPRSTLAGPKGRVWTASLPDYGLWGGPLAWLDPESGERGSYRTVAGEGSCYTLAHLADLELLVIGSTIQAGTGAQPREQNAGLILWNYEEEAAVWEGAPCAGLGSVNALCVDQNGDVYGTGVGQDQRILFKFDPNARSFSVLANLAGRPLDNGLQIRDQELFGFTDSDLYKLVDGKVVEIHREEGVFDAPGPIIDGWAYFSTNHLLRRAEV